MVIKIISKLRDITYESDLTTLVARRLGGDQIEVRRIINGYEN